LSIIFCQNAKIAKRRHIVNIDLNDFVYKHLTKTDHLIRDLQQALMLAGPVNESLERGLIRIREACEDAAAALKV
jgi:hypothetical protein